MPNTLNILLIVLFAVVSFCLSASTGGKKTATDGSGSNSSAGIGTKLKRIVTAGLLFTSLATGGAEAIGRRNAQGGNAAGLVPSHVTNRSMRRRRRNNWRKQGINENVCNSITAIYLVVGNSSAGIGTKLKRIVTAGLLFTSLATGGAEAIGRRNAQGGNAAGLVPSHVTNRSMVPPHPPAQFEMGENRVERMRAHLRELAEKMPPINETKVGIRLQ
ncbi:hypothetical protein niasHS_000066 [Heterodera schachtii]|uniref:Uncharacterized protein n=1 Tax=Heterodera schachtii TaxID=97005 RepID=A0ABD2KLU4_HETSC